MTHKISQFLFNNFFKINICLFAGLIIVFIAHQILFGELITINIALKNFYISGLFILIYGSLIINLFKPFKFYLNIKEYLNNKSKQLYFNTIHLKIKNNWITANYDYWPHSSKDKTSIYFMFYILPKIIISIALFLDIVILNKIHYLYLILTILWVPLLFHIMFYIIFNWSETTKWIAINTFEIEYVYENNYWIGTKITQKDTSLELLFSEEIYFQLIHAFVELFKHEYYLNKVSKTPWVKCINFIIYETFMLSWIYIFYQII